MDRKNEVKSEWTCGGLALVFVVILGILMQLQLRGWEKRMLVVEDGAIEWIIEGFIEVEKRLKEDSMANSENIDVLMQVIVDVGINLNKHEGGLHYGSETSGERDTKKKAY